MKRKLIKGLIIFGILFVAMFGLRVIYGYIMLPDGKEYTVSSSSRQRGLSYSVRNFASLKKKVKVNDKTVSVSQKYEKIASIQLQSKQFEEDEKQVRTIIQKNNALIQYEEKSGLKGRQVLKLAIGVPPEKFDEAISSIKKTGKLLHIQINKVDKTNEYKKLNAKKLSLTKIREALIALKGTGGKIEERIHLENRILEIEQQIQQMGVQLGEYDEENEFVTINLTMLERVVKTAVPFEQRVYVAFTWTVKYYLALMATLFFASLSILIILKILEKLKWLPNYIQTKTDE